jgi:hypothetical protein
MSKTTIIIKQEDSIAYLIDSLDKTLDREDFILSIWMLWTESVTTTSCQYQQVLHDPAVNRWFLKFIQNEEMEFRTLAKQYPELAGKAKEMDLLYVKCLNKVMSRFPQALLERAKKRSTKTEFSIITQN